MAKVGRKPFEITERVLEKVESLAAQGMTIEQIAHALGIGESTLYDKKAKNPEMLEALKRGQAKGIATISNSLFNKAKSGDVTSMIFYLKCRAGWREQDVETRELPPIVVNTYKPNESN